MSLYDLGGESDLSRLLTDLEGRIYNLTRSTKYGLPNVAARVAELKATDKEWAQMKAQEWEPIYLALLQGRIDWMKAYKQLRATPEAQWGDAGQKVYDIGMKLASGIEHATDSLGARVKPAIWLKILAPAVAAAALIPDAMKGVIRGVAEIGVEAATGATNVLKTTGKGVAEALSPLKWYLILAAGVAGLYFAYPLIKVYAEGKGGTKKAGDAVKAVGA